MGFLQSADCGRFINLPYPSKLRAAEFHVHHVRHELFRRLADFYIVLINRIVVSTRGT